MTRQGPARLTSALLVKKGNAAPAAYGQPTQTVASLVQNAGKRRGMFAAFRRAQQASVAMEPGPLPLEASTPVEPVVEDVVDAPVTAAPVPTPTEVKVERRARARRKPARRDTRARISLRVEAERYLRLKLAAAHRRITLQQVVTDAVDYYLKDVAPKLPANECACLARGLDVPPGGCQRS